MSDRFGVREIRAPRASIAWGYIPYAELGDGTPVQLPVIVVNGSKPGPIVWLAALLHGSEVYGAEVVRRITREVVAPDRLAGAIVATPAANVLAMRASEYTAPEDRTDPHSQFPGNPKGTIAQRLTYLVATELIPPADVVIDLHSNPGPALSFAALTRLDSAPEAVGRAVGLAGATRLTRIERKLSKAWTSHMADYALSLGKPAIAVHMAGWYRLDPVIVRAGVRAVSNVLRALGMIGGDPEMQDEVLVVTEPLYRDDACDIKPNRGGLVHLLVEPGASVQEGDPVGLVRDVFGEVVERLLSPVTGVMLGLRMGKNQITASGERAIYLARTAPVWAGAA